MTFDDKIKYIMEYGEYISWLDEFSNENEFFTSADTKNYTDEEKYYISNLKYLYFGLERRLHSNHFNKTDFGGHYKIKYNDSGYLIGVDEEEESVFYCKKIKWLIDDDFIDYYEVEKDNTKIVRVRNVGVKVYV